MAKIPQTMDYGARPSLQSNRLDMPGDSEAIIADSVLRAADTFTKVMAQQKEKKDRLSYSTAKADLAAADTRIRRELEEEGDYENYLENYRIRMGEALDTIAPTISDPSDRTIFDADANLSVERGVSAMAERRTMRRRDAAAASVIDLADDTQRAILATDDNASRIDKLIGFQEYVNARVDAGLLDASWAESQIKAFVSETAMGQLKTLPLRAQAALLEASIAANQDPESPDFEPTGSLADFMHQDERVEMLRQVEKQLEVEETLGAAQAAHDRVVNLYRATTPEAFAARRRAIREDKSLSPEQRRQAEVLLNDTEAFEDRNKTRFVDETIKAAQNEIRKGKNNGEDAYTITDFKAEFPDRWADLPSGAQRLLTEYSDAVQQGRPYAFATVMEKTVDDDGKELPSYSLWKRMSTAERLAVDLDDPRWQMSFNERDMRMLMDWQEAERRGSSGSLSDGLTNDQMLRSAMVAQGWVPARGLEYEDDKKFARNRLEFDRLIQQEMGRLGRDLTNPERRALLADMMTRKAFTDKGWFDEQDADADEMIEFRNMTTKQIEAGWMPLEGGPEGTNAREERVPIVNPETGAVVGYQTIEEWLIARAIGDPSLGGLGLKEEPDEDALKRAWFAVYNNMGDEEVNRRLRGK